MEETCGVIAVGEARSLGQLQCRLDFGHVPMIDGMFSGAKTHLHHQTLSRLASVLVSQDPVETVASLGRADDARVHG